MSKKITVWPDNRLQIQMLFQGLTQDEARAAWKPLLDFVNDNSADYDGQDSPAAVALPVRYFWDPDFYRRNAPAAVRFDNRSGASPSDFWWTGDGDQVGAFWYAYSSAWLPASLLKPQNQERLMDAWFAASRHWGFEIVFNKGLAGAPAGAIESARNTAMNPDVLDASRLRSPPPRAHRLTLAFLRPIASLPIPCGRVFRPSWPSYAPQPLTLGRTSTNATTSRRIGRKPSGARTIRGFQRSNAATIPTTFLPSITASAANLGAPMASRRCPSQSRDNRRRSTVIPRRPKFASI
jgi:hypothetical protein